MFMGGLLQLLKEQLRLGQSSAAAGWVVMEPQCFYFFLQSTESVLRLLLYVLFCGEKKAVTWVESDKLLESQT